MDEQEELIYDMPDVASVKLSRAEVYELLDLFERPGWGVYRKLKEGEAKASGDVALSLTADEGARAQHRALYHALMADVCFPEMFAAAVRDFERVAAVRTQKLS